MAFNTAAQKELNQMFEDHKRDGKKLVPPMSGEFQRIDFVERIFPEIIWIGFVLEFHGDTHGVELASSLIETAFREASEQPQPEFSFISAHRCLSVDGKRRIRERLEQSGQLGDLRLALDPFFRCYPKENPLAYLWSERDPDEVTEQDIATASRVIAPRLNRWSQKGTAMQAVVLYGEAITGRLHYPSDMPLPKLEAIFADFESAEAQHASSHARTSTTMVYGFYREKLGTAWTDYFWRRGLEIDSVKPHIPSRMDWATDGNPLERFRHDFYVMASMLIKELSEKLVLLPITDEEHTVINGLLARQATLAISVAENCDVWNWDVGPLYLRAMTDCYITLAWILGDTKERSQLYILHGLGQEKLWMAHYEKVLEETDDIQEKKRYQAMLAASKAWVESQSFLFFVTVNLGSWSGKSTRQMAVEADCLDLYNYAYTPYSFAAHSTWNHVGKFNAIPTCSPLHKNMRMPNILSYGGEPSIMMNAAKYLEKAARAVIEKFAFEVESPTPTAWSSERMQEIIHFFEKMSADAD
ncbi:MAG TPA: DUF5677 domain-containing protein [Chryseolinea sp.]